ncbi:MAG TPA: hypothetical protein PKD53_12345 [Chloroflexaceae bacterium]|nr:hypothetical protein [Chloroflexaceae bacterium]
MAVFLSFLLGSLFVGVLMRRRPYIQTQLVVLGLAAIATVCYFYFGML